MRLRTLLYQIIFAALMFSTSATFAAADDQPAVERAKKRACLNTLRICQLFSYAGFVFTHLAYKYVDSLPKENAPRPLDSIVYFQGDNFCFQERNNWCIPMNLIFSTDTVEEIHETLKEQHECRYDDEQEQGNCKFIVPKDFSISDFDYTSSAYEIAHTLTGLMKNIDEVPLLPCDEKCKESRKKNEI